MIRESLHDLANFDGLGEPLVQALAAAVEEVSLPKDTYLFRIGNPADALYIIRTGSVRVIRHWPRGGIMSVLHLAAGGILGEEILLNSSSRAHSAITDTPSEFFKLPRSAIQELAAREPLLQTAIQAVVDARSSAPFEPVPDGEAGIQLVGHRSYVGGLWDELGTLQFNFLLAQGLTSTHCLLDIARGSLRGGVHFISFLAPGNYLGLDREETLVELGIEQKLGIAMYQHKQPEFVISTCFEFDKFSKQPHFSLAHSLFTHLTPEDIRQCLGNLRSFVNPGHRFFATFREGDSAENLTNSHSQAVFAYSRAELERLGRQTGWQATYIGEWGHPRQQKMMRYEAR